MQASSCEGALSQGWMQRVDRVLLMQAEAVQETLTQEGLQEARVEEQFNRSISIDTLFAGESAMTNSVVNSECLRAPF